MTATLTLSEFLLERTAEDEAWARARLAEVPEWQDASKAYGGLPERVLAECEAKRRIVGEHETDRAAYPGTSVESDPCCMCCSAGGEYPGEFPCRTMRFLALPYVDHPDYDPKWRA